MANREKTLGNAGCTHGRSEKLRKHSSWRQDSFTWLRISEAEVKVKVKVKGGK
jgi:hypothetical protein